MNFSMLSSFNYHRYTKPAVLLIVLEMLNNLTGHNGRTLVSLGF